MATCDIVAFIMKRLSALALLCIAPYMGHAGALNLATLSCSKYQNEVLPAATDSLNTVMWLFGYSVAKSGAHVMYSDALAPFGFALDTECKSNPIETILDALTIVKPETKKPMDLTEVDCEAFASRHTEFIRTDADSAHTIMMWLFGFSVAKSGSHIFDADYLPTFETTLLAECAKHPKDDLFHALTSIKPAAVIK